MSELRNELTKEIKNMKLTDDDLDAVVGGFREDAALPTKGMNIVCPNCHSSNKDSFSGNALLDKKTGSVEYHCKDCGADFICYDGNVILKSNWIGLCKKKNYSYPFA